MIDLSDKFCVGNNGYLVMITIGENPPAHVFPFPPEIMQPAQWWDVRRTSSTPVSHDLIFCERADRGVLRKVDKHQKARPT